MLAYLHYLIFICLLYFCFVCFIRVFGCLVEFVALFAALCCGLLWLCLLFCLFSLWWFDLLGLFG